MKPGVASYLKSPETPHYGTFSTLVGTGQSTWFFNAAEAKSYFSEEKDVHRFSVAAFSEPFRLQGGDFYDVFKMSSDHVGLVVADACGKGTTAAMLIAQMREMFVDELNLARSIHITMQNVNKHLQKNIPYDKFVTLFYGILDLKTGELMYANAGHNAPAVIHQDHSQQWLAATGPGLGILPEAAFITEKITLVNEDILLLYTDGITEVLNTHQELYGEQRLASCVTNHLHRAPEEMLETIMNEIKTFACDRFWHDDRTLIIIKLY